MKRLSSRAWGFCKHISAMQEPETEPEEDTRNTSGVRDEDHREGKAQEAEPGDNPKLGVVVDVVVQDRGREGAQLADGRGHAVRGATHLCRVRLSCKDIHFRAWS